ncbi:zinc-binding alcohol dehydrogenase family protein [Clostridium sp. AL.422]|nr:MULTISPECIES: zinc-binding alcohol dehydrogenase family protein [unclassified Clostridium]MDV4150466.1 zinc-binding alcohol dehydrogenase family protein [Clostridium sp. AL.422]
MKQIVIKEPKKVTVEEVEIPKKKDGEALIKVLYGGICGSDLGTYKGTFLYAGYPRIPGHEFSAEVVEVDENEYGIKPGMIVTGNPYYNCGECYSCERGFLNCCENNQTLGAQRDGIFRQYFSIPVERLYYGKGLDAKELAMIEPFCIGYHSVKRGRVKKGDKVLIVGAGTIGLLAAMAAIGQGAEVYVSDIQRNRLQKALEIGAAGIIVTGEENFNERVTKITKCKGFDVCIECVGLPETFQNCIDAAAFRGRVVVVGVGKRNHDFAYTRIQTKELDIYGSRNALKEDFIELIDRVSNKEFDLKLLLTGVYDLENAESAFEDLVNNQDKMIKSLIKLN